MKLRPAGWPWGVLTSQVPIQKSSRLAVSSWQPAPGEGSGTFASSNAKAGAPAEARATSTPAVHRPRPRLRSRFMARWRGGSIRLADVDAVEVGGPGPAAVARDFPEL